MLYNFPIIFYFKAMKQEDQINLLMTDQERYLLLREKAIEVTKKYSKLLGIFF